MKYILNKKTVFLDVLLIVLISSGSIFAASWIYSNIIVVNGQQPQLVLTSTAGPYPVVNETFTLTAILSVAQNPMVGKTVVFFEDDINIGTATTDVNGNAVFQWTVKAGIHNYKAGYEIV